MSAALAIPACTQQNAEAGPSGYNVLLITLDTTRADHLSCYGYDKNTSPNLDALAADGVLFEMAISTASVTPISHASILTGLNPYHHGLRVFYGPTGHFLTDEFPSLATILKKHGWQTGAFISAYPASERFGLHWGFDTFESDVADKVMTRDPSKPLPKDGFCQNIPTASAQRRADPTTDQALGWLKKAHRPFFSWLHYFDPHDPSLVPPNKFIKQFGIKINEKITTETLYDPEIFFMDLHIGRVIEYLKKTGEYDSTIIIAIGDHGQGMGQHNWFSHRLLYQEQIRLPFIMRIPDGARGIKITELVRSI
ncbi:MAG: sulfatase, partial [Planctomycetota bacterium]